MTDTIILISIPLTVSLGSQAIWNARYHLTTAQQKQVETWASAARLIAYIEDVPPVTPLVLWLKESGLKAENPSNCEGLMGLHSAVTSGELPCFPAGPVSPRDIAYQLQLGARTFKRYCPEVHYSTVDPKMIKRCYLRYNAGPASRVNPDHSAYVMNGYDAQHENMILTDVRGRQYRLTALGAWPAHLAIQAQLAQRREPAAPGSLLAPALLAQELLDKAWLMREGTWLMREGIAQQSDVVLDRDAEPATCRGPEVRECFIAPHTGEEEALQPAGSPLLVKPAEVSPLACGLLPGIDLFPAKPSVVLAPMSGYLTRYMDGLGHLAVQIENEAWTIWLTGLRSYTAPEGEVQVGEAVGAIGGAGSRTPSIHYAVYDKINVGFVDALSFIPAEMCPSVE